MARAPSPPIRPALPPVDDTMRVCIACLVPVFPVAAPSSSQPCLSGLDAGTLGQSSIRVASEGWMDAVGGQAGSNRHPWPCRVVPGYLPSRRFHGASLQAVSIPAGDREVEGTASSGLSTCPPR